jgi:hypothetical protein
MQPGTAGGSEAAITPEQRSANANASDEEKIAKMTALRASGLEGEAVKRKMIEEGYVFD